jgi:hypothetical protein
MFAPAAADCAALPLLLLLLLPVRLNSVMHHMASLAHESSPGMMLNQPPWFAVLAFASSGH